MEFEFLLGLIKTFASLSIGSNVGTLIATKIKLHKLDNYKNKIIVDDNDILAREKNIKYEDVDFYKKEVLIPLVSKLREYISEEDMRIAYRNINNLKMKPAFLSTLLGISGSYNPYKNRIKYSSKKTLAHEFLHMASTTIDEENKISLVGFNQQKGYAMIGRELNEGYTELLTARLYSKNQKIEFMSGYRKPAKIAQLIELFFDDPKEMAHLYFTHDLPGLIKHLEKFAPRDEIIELIIDVDDIDDLSVPLNPYPTIKSIQVQLKLYEWFSSKIHDLKRLQQFKDLVCENPIVAYTLHNQNISLSRDNPYLQYKPIIEENKEPIPSTITTNIELSTSLPTSELKEKERTENINNPITAEKTTVISPTPTYSESLPNQDSLPVTNSSIDDSDDDFLKQLDDFITGLTDEQWKDLFDNDQYQDSTKVK